MIEKNISQKFKLKNADEIRNYFFEDIEQNELMNRKQKEVCTALNISNYFLLYTFLLLITGCI